MASITRMNKRRIASRQERIDVSKLQSRKSPIASASEFNKRKQTPSKQKAIDDSKQEKKPQTTYVRDLHSETLMKRLSGEMETVKAALTDFANTVEQNAARQELQLKSQESAAMLTPKGFRSEKCQCKLDKEALKEIRKIIKEEMGTSGGFGAGIPMPIPTFKKTPQTPPTTTKPTPIRPTPIIPSAALPKAAYDKAGRLGSIFRRTVRSKGIGAAISKTAKLAMPSGKVAGAIGKGAIPGSILALGITAWDANDQKIQIDELEKSGAITAEQAEEARGDINWEAVGTGVGTVVGGIAGSVAGPIGSIAGSVAGGMVGGKVAKYFRSETKKVSPDTGTMKAAKPVSTDVKAAIDDVSKDFNIPKDEMLAKAQMESGMSSSVKNQAGSGATGLYQFVQSTWNSLIKKYPDIVSKYDIGPVSSQRDDRLDAKKSAVMYAILRNDNKTALKGLTTGNDEVDTYLTHLLGSGTAKTFIKTFNVSPNSLVTSIPEIGESTNVYKQNSGVFSSNGRPRSLAQVVEYIKNWNKSALQAAKKKMDVAPKINAQQESPTVAIPSQKGGAFTSINAAARAGASKVPTQEEFQQLSETLSNPRKISTTEQKIMETEQAAKMAKEKQKQVPVIVQQAAPTIVQPKQQPSNQVNAGLTTRNDNWYLNATKKQEMERMK